MAGQWVHQESIRPQRERLRLHDRHELKTLASQRRPKKRTVSPTTLSLSLSQSVEQAAVSRRNRLFGPGEAEEAADLLQWRLVCILKRQHLKATYAC